MRPSPERRPSPSRRSRMSNGVSPQGGAPHPHHHQRYSPPQNYMGPQPQQRRSPQNGAENGLANGHGDGPTPICRCRVLYLGSAVPHVTKDGLQGIQEPLKELYPEDGALGAKGIDSWLSVWSNGFLLENMDENGKKVTRFFPVESLHYCAAVRYVLVPGTSSGDKVARFLPLDSPFARNPNINHPPLFAAILRRTSGIKVLECHVFICKRETAANALVRCSFHAYADSTYAKHLEGGQSLYGTLGGMTPVPSATPLLVPPPQMSGMRPETPREYQQSVIEMSEDSINSIEKVEEWRVLGNGNASTPRNGGNGAAYQHDVSTNNTSPRENGNGGSSPEDISVFNGDENHKVWAGKQIQEAQDAIYDYGSTMRSFRSSASGLSHRNRPRQMVMPSSPPPPPIPEEGSSSPNKDERKEMKKKKKRSKSRDAVDGSTDLLNAPTLLNGSTINGHGRAASAIGGRQVNGDGYPNGHYPRMNGHPRGLPPPHPQPIMMVPVGGKKAGTFSARQKGMQHPIPPFMMYGGPPPPFGVQYGPPPGYYGPPHPQMMGRPGSRAMEEPIYMPHNARPLSPVASYQPGHFPHEAYYNQQQYATIDKANRYRKGKHSSKNGSKSSKDSKGVNGKQHQSSDSNAEDSEFGLYKKGQANDRAFSYSIRNEQRSRSYGSLANMQFGPNGEALPPLPPGAEMIQNGHHPEGKKERELMQMMGDLDLTEELIERSEVPPGLYPPGQPPNIMYGAPLPPPPHPHMVMMPSEPLVAGHHRRRRR